MFSDLTTCNCCNYEYNQTERVAKILPQCGHTFCLSCLKKLVDAQNQIKCPLDNGTCPLPKTVEDLSENNKAMKFIEEKSRVEFCSLHQEEIIKICLAEKTKLCRRCLNLNVHQDHDIQTVKDVRNMVKSKKEDLVKILTEYKRYEDETNKLILEQKNDFFSKATQRFETFKQIIDMKKDSLIAIMECFFSNEFNYVNQVADCSFGIIKVEQMISNLDEKNINLSSLESLQEQTPKFQLEHNRTNILGHIDGFQQQLKKALNSFESFLSFQVDQFRFIFSVDNSVEKSQNTYIENNSRLPQMIKSRCVFKSTKESALSLSSRNHENNLDQLASDLLINTENLMKTKELNLLIDEKGTCSEIVESLNSISNNLDKVTKLMVTLKCPDIDDLDLLELDAFNILSLKNLQTLVLKLNDCQVTDQSVTKILHNVSHKFADITNFELNLSNTKIATETIKVLSNELLQHSTKLEELKLDLHNTLISDESVCSIFVPMENIKVFKIDLSKTQIGDKTFESLNQIIFPSSIKLERFNLNLSDTFITNQSLSQLLFHSTTIKDIQISLRNTKICTSGIKTFVKKNLPRLSQLQTFELELENTEVKDDKIAQFFASQKFQNAFCLKLNIGELTNQSMDLSFTNQNSGIFKKFKEKFGKKSP